jgi:hypothetical protein
MKLLIGVAVLLLLAACLWGWFYPATKRTVPDSAIGVHFVGAEAGRIAITNTTAKRLLVEFSAVQIRGTNGWIDVPLVVSSEVIPKHEMVSKRINPAPSGEPWRLKMMVGEETAGGDRLVRATTFYLRDRWERLRGRSGMAAIQTNAFARTAIYWTHETVLFSPVFD